MGGPQVLQPVGKKGIDPCVFGDWAKEPELPENRRGLTTRAAIRATDRKSVDAPELFAARLHPLRPNSRREQAIFALWFAWFAAHIVI